MSAPSYTSASAGTLHGAADALLMAAISRRPIAPLTQTYPELTVDDAYAIQAINVASREAAGAKLVGHKIGLTAKAMQEMLGVSEPDYGVMFEDTRLRSGDIVEVSQLIAPRVEPEIAFVLGADLTGPDITAEDVLAATDHVLPALEVIDSRIADWKIKLVDTIADNASYARIVLGDKQTRPADVVLAAATVDLRVDGQTMQEGAGGAVLGHPAKAVAWLANALHRYGVTLQAGEVVLPGSMTAAVPLVAGSTVLADYGVLGTVEVSGR
jgi:2-oxopent-4-enoate hydratase